MKRTTTHAKLYAALAAACAISYGIAHADEKSADDWQYTAAIYGFFPNIGGTTRFPAGNGGEIDVGADDLISNLKLATMGSFAAQKGNWGFFTDLIYLNVGDSISNSRSIAAGGVPLPPGITADASLDIKGWVWTLAGNYRAISTPKATVDVFAGARLLDAKGELDYAFSAEFGPFVGPARAGSAEAERHSWDGIVGTKGRVNFGPGGTWFVPYYLYVGAGNSDLTYQASVGIGYSASWGDVFATWRYLRYEFSGNRNIEELDFNGPAVGVAFHF